jgi:hypothetical protein
VRLFHRHRWQVLEQQVLPSAWEQMAAAGTAESVTKAKGMVFRQSVVVRYRCPECESEKVERL